MPRLLNKPEDLRDEKTSGSNLLYLRREKSCDLEYEISCELEYLIRGEQLTNLDFSCKVLLVE